ncbi:MAG: sugar-binding protein [Armatimonadota bacterium]
MSSRSPPMFLFVLFSLQLGCQAGSSLSNAQVSVSFDPDTGSISGITSKSVQCIRSITDMYLLDSISSDETEDVVENAKESGNTVVFVCSNRNIPDLGIEKEYRLEDGKIIKKAAYTLAGKSKALLKTYSSAVVNPEFRKSGHYYYPMFDGVNASDGSPIIPAASITNEKKLGIYHASIAAFVNPTLKLGFAHYKYKVNGDNVWPDSVIPGNINSQGWKIAITPGYISKSEKLIVETAIQVFDGDIRNFHKDFVGLPEGKKHNVPDWFTKIKFYSHHPLVDEVIYPYGTSWVESQSKYLRSDEYQILWPFLWNYDGEVPLSGSITPVKYGPTTIPVSDYISAINSLRTSSLKVKLTPYTTLAGIGQLSQTVKDHPEWLLRDANGKPLETAANAADYILKLNNPDCRQSILTQMRELFSTYKGDYIYLDTTFPREVIDAYDKKVYYDHWKMLNDISEMAWSNNSCVVMNGANVNRFADAGFWEYMDAPWDQVDATDWRILADAAYISKYYHNNQTRWVSWLYWPLGGTTYSNKILLYAIKPSWFWIKPGLRSILHQYIVTQLAWETKDFAIPDDIDIYPVWQKNETDTLECNVLESPDRQAIIVGAISHSENEGNEKIAMSVSGLKGKSAYIWHIVPNMKSWKLVDYPPEKLPLVSYSGFTSSDTEKPLELNLNAPKQNELNTFVVSSIPVFVYAIEDVRQGFLLPGCPEVNISDCIASADRVKFSCRASKKWTSLVLCSGIKHSVTVDNCEVPIKTLRFDEKTFILADVPSGKHSVEVKSGELTENEKINNIFSGFISGANDQDADNDELVSPCISVSELEASSWRKASQDNLNVTSVVRNNRSAWCFKYSGEGKGVVQNVFAETVGPNKGITFRLCSDKPGDISFSILGHEKKIALPTDDWQTVTLTADDFGITNQADWANLPSISVSIEGEQNAFYISSLRFIADKEKKKEFAQVVIPKTSISPRIDGEQGEEWGKAAKLELNDKQHTSVQVMYDASNIYVLFSCPQDVMKNYVVAQRDAPIWAEDDVEVFLEEDGLKRNYFQFATNPAGSQYDLRVTGVIRDPDWNPDWSVSCSSGKGVWIVEMAIPFISLGKSAPKPGDVWKGNFCRQVVGGTDTGAFTWCGGFHDPDNWGLLEFSNGGDARN